MTIDEALKRLDDYDYTQRGVLEDVYQQGKADAIEEVLRAMHHEAFEVDHEKDGMQKWDSGNWIRYKLFEKVLEQLKEQKDEID